MNEKDENGWYHIHHAAFRGFIKSIERFVNANKDQLELETEDEYRSTPLLLAVTNGNKETVECLISLGAKVNAINNQNHGVVELSANKHFIEILDFFLEKNFEDLPVWKRLLNYLSSEVEDEAESAGKCLRTLTQGSSEGMHPNWKAVVDNGGVPIIVKVIKSQIGDRAKTEALHCLINLIPEDVVKEQVASSGGIPALVRLLKSSNNFIVQLAATVLKEVSRITELADQAAQAGAIPNLVKVIQTVRDPEVLVECVYCLGFIAEAGEAHQGTIGNTSGCVQALVGHLEEAQNQDLLMALTISISKIACNNKNNQNAIVEEGGAAHIITLTGLKNRDLQLSAVDAIRYLAENNSSTQKTIKEEGALIPLNNLLKKSRAERVQEKTAAALWAEAGDYIEEQRSMASIIGVQTLIEFLSTGSEKLHLIGSEALGVLSRGALNKQTEIGNANGIHSLVRLLRSDKEHIVLSAIRTLRYLCVGVGYVPHLPNQNSLSQARGIKFLVALMVHPENELIKVEAAQTLGCVCLGNEEVMKEIQSNVEFSYVRILRMMYSQDPLVRLLAGAALAAFAFNSVTQQREIAEQGGVRFNCFEPFLVSVDEFFRCNAAFQVVVLSRIIPDEEQAVSSAKGIKLLVDLIQESQSETIQSLAADCLARLAHTRAGVPAAIVSIHAVDLLCNLMLVDAELVQGCAAVALGYLSHNHDAERQLLNRCRKDPYLMKALKYYCSKARLSPSFIEGWHHYKTVGLPPIEEGRPSLVSTRNLYVPEKASGRPMTMLSGEVGSSSNPHSSPSHFLSQQEDSRTNLTGRSSRASRASHAVSFRNHSGHRSQMSNAAEA
ncbi:ankyrin and armadillo repeat-containing protein-like [Lingula anatina]|uniref:Ankyrin and armadillo repeat-containing protein-like n=1 Tax=Lingula anatina TaxID=7574 RepID=A0A1S3KBH8_LINAN|nr:ankyrin and armadillo repeat-containing protein-like [Lingula anatina]|eukprot:XP_013419847.1 ankyrin and armadillo repeat-containing protein-like [Lingula anatina]